MHADYDMYLCCTCVFLCISILRKLVAMGFPEDKARIALAGRDFLDDLLGQSV